MIDPAWPEIAVTMPAKLHHVMGHDLAGDLDQASAFLLHPFWLKQFAQVGATATIADTALDRVAKSGLHPPCETR